MSDFPLSRRQIYLKIGGAHVYLAGGAAYIAYGSEGVQQNIAVVLGLYACLMALFSTLPTVREAVNEYREPDTTKKVICHE